MKIKFILIGALLISLLSCECKEKLEICNENLEACRDNCKDVATGKGNLTFVLSAIFSKSHKDKYQLMYVGTAENNPSNAFSIAGKFHAKYANSNSYKDVSISNISIKRINGASYKIDKISSDSVNADKEHKVCIYLSEIKNPTSVNRDEDSYEKDKICDCLIQKQFLVFPSQAL